MSARSDVNPVKVAKYDQTHAPTDDQWFEVATRDARSASRMLARTRSGPRNQALLKAAAHLREYETAILRENRLDLEAFSGPEHLRDRLVLDQKRVQGLAAALEAIAYLPDPLVPGDNGWVRPNGLHIQEVPAPIGVIGMIYESRPGVGIEAAGLCIKSGNAVILRGGSEAMNSTRALHASIIAGLRRAGLPEHAVQIAPSADRALVGKMLAAAGEIDLLIPRGSASLVRRVTQEARVPVLAHSEGVNHTYIHEAADLAMARAIITNAKMRRPSVCGATETILIDAALDHIEHYGSHHTDAIVTEDTATARRFLAECDSAVTMWNTSTQFSDGGEFGYGGEIGISTGRIHARGPIGLRQLVTKRYNVTGTGQLRP
ncbi:glutamate-5-semialdehyde dehydrogenase [Komagataeibacter diospyri]|uniref:glutamate-5-semialdehyde dehydrogenase n=1 Tax=Komagataeibacter diospyri TaxID=1932662 RepID=UPI003757EB67